MNRFLVCLVFLFFTCIAHAQNNPKDIVQQHKPIFHEPPKRIPSASSVDAPLLGNGFTGVAISGEPEKQVYHIARNDFWRLKSSFNESFPAVLGKVEISIPALKGATYHVEQDLYEAKTYSSFGNHKTEVEMVSFVSATEDLMIIELSAKGQSSIDGKIRLLLPGVDELIDDPPFNIIYKDDRKEGATAEGISWITRGFSEDVDIPTRASVATKILGQSSDAFTLDPGGKVWIICSFSSNFKSKDSESAVIGKVKSFTQGQLTTIEDEHKGWWADFWEMSWVDIPDEKIEKQYYLSNYAMASCSRDKDFPPSIFGSWITKERPDWNGDYHLNYNHMAPYYGLYSSNHIEQADPHDAPILAIMDRGRYYSREVTGIEGGIMLPVGIGPMGMETTRRNELMETHRHNWIEEGNVEDEGLFFGQKSNSSYCVVNIANRFYYTYDLEYAKSVYPFVKGVATFWEEYLTYEEGRYVIYNDAIHEGTVGTKNPILSLGLAPMVLKLAINMSSELGVDGKRHKKWQHIIDHLSGYTYQKKKGKKVFRYTEKGTDWWQNNTLGIQHIYPSGQISLNSDSDLIQVSKNTIEVMQRWLDFNGSNSFFPAAVRIGYDSKIILEQLNRYVNHTYPNGFQLDNPHGIENLSTVPNTINEMLLQSHEGILRLFPVWPLQQDAKFYQLRAYGAFLVSSELISGEISFIKILSEKGRDCRLQNPWNDKDVKLIRKNNVTEILSGSELLIHTSQNELVELAPIVK